LRRAACRTLAGAAGLWDRWSGLDGGDDLPNATIIAGEANGWIRGFHDRMPIILDWRVSDGREPQRVAAPATDDALREWIFSARM
jgi:putative SOS response-associated peptidase YedK